MEPVIIVHGGAWSLPDNLVTAVRSGVKSAAQAGYKVLRNGGTAVDAVQAALTVMEDDPNFDAGKGSVLTSKGEVEMDAVIMDGRTLKTGAVACVQNIKNPIALARTVMEKTDHNLLVGQGANLFAEEQGIKKVSTDSLVSIEAKMEYQEFKEKGGYGGAVGNLFKSGNKHETVGAVALDSKGNIAYGTSTGGITYKMPGRVGDSPIIGAGGYADNEVGGVSCTGHGESISKVVLAHQITNLMRQGIPAQAAADNALDTMAKRVKGYGGVIVLSNKGDAVRSFTTERMAWAFIKKDLLHYGINVGEMCTERVDRWRVFDWFRR